MASLTYSFTVKYTQLHRCWVILTRAPGVGCSKLTFDCQLLSRLSRSSAPYSYITPRVPKLQSLRPHHANKESGTESSHSSWSQLCGSNCCSNNILDNLKPSPVTKSLPPLRTGRVIDDGNDCHALTKVCPIVYSDIIVSLLSCPGLWDRRWRKLGDGRTRIHYGGKKSSCYQRWRLCFAKVLAGTR